jgi:hypothetical protein
LKRIGNNIFFPFSFKTASLFLVLTKNFLAVPSPCRINLCALIIEEETILMKNKIVSGWNMLFLMMAIVLIGGCFGGVANRAADNMVPRYHAWDSMTAQGEEQQGYSLYTYVIQNGNSNLKTSDGKRNEALLIALTQPVAEPDEPAHAPGQPAGVLRNECNIFYIPLTQKILPEFASALALYNLPLAHQIATGFARIIQNNYNLGQLLLFGEGPFLVSSPVPISQLNYRPARILIADLTEIKPEAMRQVVAGFRQPQKAQVGDDLDRFRLIRLALLDSVLPLSRLAVANTVPIAPPTPYGAEQYPVTQ